MIEQVADYTVATVGGAGGLVALAFYLRKIFKGMGLEDSRTDAEKGVIHTLRDEVTRLAEINTQMSNALTSLQMEIIKLRNENIALMGEIAALKQENIHLTKEVLKLNEQLGNWDTMCANCEHKKPKEQK
jgi:FtsZ-binding cell division protein ZapB